MSAVIDERQRIAEALSWIPPDVERDTWVRVAMSIKSELADDGFALFDSWSRGGQSYVETDARDTWRSLKVNGGVTIATLYAIAKRYGFEPAQHKPIVVDHSEIERRRTRRREDAEREKAADLKKQRETATHALAIWTMATPSRDDHPYLQKKGMLAFDELREAEVDKIKAITGWHPVTSKREKLVGRVLIARIQSGEKLKSIEMIDGEGRKSALPGAGTKTGGYWVCAQPSLKSSRILLGEGIATVRSAHLATGDAAIAALTCGNLPKAVVAIREMFPDVPIVVLADIGNGQEKALQAAQAVGCAVVFPEFGDDRPEGATDFNDMHQLLGIEAVKLRIAAAIRTSSPPEEEPKKSTVFPGIEDRPCYRVYEAWQEIDGRKLKPGVYLHSTKSEKSDAAPTLVDKWISTPARILATTSNGEDAEYGRLIEIQSPAGKWKRWAMPMSNLAGDGSEALGVLMSEGLIPYFNDKRAVLRYIAEEVPTIRMRAASVTGWNGGAFVLPHTVIGADDIWFQASGRTAPYASAGAFEEWRELAALAPGNPLLMLAFSAAFAGPLLGPLNVDGGGAHIYGDSSSGKTTALHAAVSVWGSPAFKRTWRATANGLEGTGSLHSDTLLALDEIGEIDPKSLYESAYSLMNGMGKTRANRHGEARQASRWRVFLLSTGELTIAGRMSVGGIEAKAGQELRILDVPVQGKYGLFDNLHGRTTGAALSDEVRNLAARTYGHAGPRFVDALVRALRQDLHLADELHPILEAFRVEGQERRAARTFAICGLAGELAARWEIVPWAEGDATRAAMHAFELWRRRRGTNGQSAEHAAVLRSLSDFIDRHAEGRFSSIDGSADIVRDRAGYWKQEFDRRLYLFTAAGLREALKGHDLDRALKALETAGALAAVDPGRRTKTTRTPDGRTPRLYHVDPDKIGDESQ